MKRLSFPADFLWGTATASYQVEGAVHEDGRGTSIWDTFSHAPGNVLHGHTADISADQYHRYAEDIGLMKNLGVGAYRFSIAWPRIVPDGRGRPNPKGFDYYNRLVDSLLEAGIQPAPTLYHWDLPQRLQDEGGWTNRAIVDAFRDYAVSCFNALGDRVKMWITMNEPWCAAFLGYFHGVHAPGLQDLKLAYSATHHLNLAHGMAVEAFRSRGAAGRIGTTLNISTPRPATKREADVDAAARMSDQQTGMFLDPIFGKGYPERHLAAYPDVTMPVRSGDMETIATPVDFVGLNYYTEHVARYDANHPEHFASVPTGYRQTEMGWDIVPWGLYRQLKYVHDTYGGPDIYVTENGCAVDDVLDPSGTRCHDRQRIDYLADHFEACAQAVSDGVNLRGYFLWSFIDNFEWSFGFSKRFGIVYCDYLDQRRVPKDSYYYYREVIAGYEGP